VEEAREVCLMIAPESIMRAWYLDGLLLFELLVLPLVVVLLPPLVGSDWAAWGG